MELDVLLPLSRKWNQSTGQPAHGLRVQGVDTVEDNLERQVSDHGASVGLPACLYTREHVCRVRVLSRALCVIGINITAKLRSQPHEICLVFVLGDVALPHCLGWLQTFGPRYTIFSVPPEHFDCRHKT